MTDHHSSTAEPDSRGHAPVRWEVRRAAPGDGARLRALRLRALRDVPQYFLETYDQAAHLTEAQWDARIDRSLRPGQHLLVVGDIGGMWAGMAGAFLDTEGRSASLRLPLNPTAHWVTVWGMYTTPEIRRHGLAAQLCTEIYQWAATEAHADWLGLDVRDTNTDAIRFYQAQGFNVVARQEHPALAVTSLTMMRPVLL